MKIRKIEYDFATASGFNTSKASEYSKGHYIYNVYGNGNKIMIEKQDTKSESYNLYFFEIVD